MSTGGDPTTFLLVKNHESGKTNLRESEDDENSDGGERFRSHEPIGFVIEKIGFGAGQSLVMLASILGWLGDGMQPLLLSFILPSIKREWPDLSSGLDGIIGSSLFLGMLAGSFLFGTVADKIGRRNTLAITSKCISSIIRRYVFVPFCASAHLLFVVSNTFFWINFVFFFFQVFCR
uniref:Major facilitator superfamily (MFS) profile domain-containing protein n=1 Tax=Palpitomonas bilix TaxID=652834 RepID=A0A7S3D8S2_9EUKA|mmetsp:Transcript_26623/g.68333  ORF Transcript_26623/g.68333 Transcript_26623/m.68333 type:complete len:177 (+) Transcript_26623:65-595(+)